MIIVLSTGRTLALQPEDIVELRHILGCVKYEHNEVFLPPVEELYGTPQGMSDPQAPSGINFPVGGIN